MFRYLNELLYAPIGELFSVLSQAVPRSPIIKLDALPNLGDIVLDCRSCWGDTTFEFAASVGSDGKV